MNVCNCKTGKKACQEPAGIFIGRPFEDFCTLFFPLKPQQRHRHIIDIGTGRPGDDQAAGLFKGVVGIIVL